MRGIKELLTPMFASAAFKLARGPQTTESTTEADVAATISVTDADPGNGEAVVEEGAATATGGKPTGRGRGGGRAKSKPKASKDSKGLKETGADCLDQSVDSLGGATRLTFMMDDVLNFVGRISQRIPQGIRDVWFIGRMVDSCIEFAFCKEVTLPTCKCIAKSPPSEDKRPNIFDEIFEAVHKKKELPSTSEDSDAKKKKKAAIPGTVAARIL